MSQQSDPTDDEELARYRADDQEFREKHGHFEESQYSHSTESQYRQAPGEVQARWSQHVDRMLRRERLAGGGLVIEEEPR